MTALTPWQVLQSPGLQLVDIRPLAERYGSVGFVPGSLAVPPEHDVEQHRRAVLDAAWGRVPVLVCTSGRRAREGADSCLTDEAGRPLPYLDGGVLGWGGAGLPLSGLDLGPGTDAIPLHVFPRHMASCFVGELVESTLEHEQPPDPLTLLRQCFAAAGESFEHPTPQGLLRVLDVAAIASLEMGTRIERVAGNLDHMLAQLPACTRALIA